MSDLAVNQPGQLAVQRPDLGTILAAAVAGELTKEKVELAKELLAMQAGEEARALVREDREAKRAFVRAMMGCRKEIGKVVAIRRNDGNKTYYADLEAMQDKAESVIEKYGLCVSFKQGAREADRSVVICVVDHEDGHTETYPFAVRDVRGNGATNEAQADLAANTYGKRRAFANAFNIRIDNSDDARAVGAAIDRRTAEALRRRALLTVRENMLPALWTSVGAVDAEHVPAGRLAELEAILTRNEERKGIKHEPENVTAETPDQDWK